MGESVHHRFEESTMVNAKKTEGLGTLEVQGWKMGMRDSAGDGPAVRCIQRLASARHLQ